MMMVNSRMILMMIHPPNNDSSEAPNGDPSEAPNGDHPSVVVSSARYVNLANTTVHLSLDMISLSFIFCIALW